MCYLHGRGVLKWLLKLTRGFHYSAFFSLSDTISFNILCHSDSSKFSTHFPPLHTQLLTRCPNTSQRFRGQDSLSLASPQRYLTERGYSSISIQTFSLYVHHCFFTAFLFSQRFHHTKGSYLSFSHAYAVVRVEERNCYFFSREIYVRTKHLIWLYSQILIR